MASQQFIVVGGGLAGLASAVALAQTGAKTIVYEQSRQLGGRAGTQHENGFALNFGPHALYRNGPLYNLLREWHIPFSGKPPRLSKSAYLVVGGQKHTFPTGASNLFFTGALGLADKFEAGRVLRLLTTGNPAALGSIDMSGWLDRNVRRPRVRQLVQALIRLSTYCSDMPLLSAGAAIRQLQGALSQGVIYVDGGWETIVHGLRAKAESLGVQIVVGAPVERVERGGVRLAGGQHNQSSGTVLAVPPDAVERLTGARLPQLAPLRLACLDLGLRSLPKEFGTFALGLDQPAYLSMHSMAAALAPQGQALVHVGKYLSQGESAAREELEAFTDLVIPGWRSHAAVARYLPNMIVSHAIVTPIGRPAIDAVPIPGVALAGDWVGDQAMLADAAIASALRAAAFVSGSKAAAA
jgi:phytoene dehydrogenase-like protein